MFGTLKNVFSTLFSNMGGGLSGMSFAFSGFLAGGGPTAPGNAYMVGEEGPELFTPGTTGVVTPQRSPTVNNYIDARGADAGVEGRVRMAMRDSEDRAVVRAIASVKEMQKRSTA